MACDVESGNWKHYNSMRPRRGVRDEHYNEALKVKQWVADHHNKFVKPRVTAAAVGSELFDGSFVSVLDCPQQVPESLWDFRVLHNQAVRTWCRSEYFDGRPDPNWATSCNGGNVLK
ncbi:uncharacterized protein LOC114285529 isoform X2 [Camellia sinensis]|uniref:uncharacterized protein LOC114285529 isoform X2 n=1 Tax=Camellia sinensis TaxID=4442 RepID=UPI0010360F73|nr:uncharacterized protein LOC114285529 isoform X2 [Camellia sinensis]